MSRQHSLAGVGDFAKTMDKALKSDSPASYEDEEYNDNMDDFEHEETGVIIHRAEELRVPEQGQSQGFDDDDDAADDDGDGDLQRALEQELTTLTAMTRCQTKDYAKLVQLEEKHVECDPYVILNGMKANIDGMPTSSDKTQAVAMFKAILHIWKAGRDNKGVRDFTAELFSNTKTYYDIRECHSIRTLLNTHLFANHTVDS